MTTLEYHGRAMSADPVNWSLVEIAELLRTGQPAVVILEPGDGTRYRLCIVPCWALGVGPYLDDVGIPAIKSNEYLLVSKFDGHRGEAWFAYDGIGDYDIESVENPWSRELLAWWLQQLWDEIKERGEEGE